MSISAEALAALMAGAAPHAVLDVRERGAYERGHIFRTTSLPRRLLEVRLPVLVSAPGTPIVLVDEDGRLAALAARTVRAMGYRDVRALEGGLAAWRGEGRPLVQGLNVPSKVFGEQVLRARRTPELAPRDLAERLRGGADLVILDARTPEEHAAGCVPGAINVPGGELVLRITDLVSGPDTAVVVHCGGRTRSYIGTESLRRAGLPNPVFALRNGTMGWQLAGLALERGSARTAPAPSPSARAHAARVAERVAAEDGVRFIAPAELRDRRERRGDEPLQILDVRTAEEYETGHVAGSEWAPGGQLVQATDDYVAVWAGTIVLVCDTMARSVMTASWLMRMGLRDVAVLAGGLASWREAGGALEAGRPEPAPAGWQAAPAGLVSVEPGPLGSATVLCVDRSDDYVRGHVPGAGWICRSRLEWRIQKALPDRHAPLVLTCADGVQSTLAAVMLRELGYTNVRVLDGGLRGWRAAGLPVETGPTRLLDEPDDVVRKPYERGVDAMRAYLAWEEQLDREGRSPEPLFPGGAARDAWPATG